MRTNTPVLVLGTLLAMAGPALASAQANEPSIGTWTLNVAKSTYSPGPGPKSSTRTYTAVRNGYSFSSKGVDATGKPTATTFTAHFDGKYYPMTGSTTVDSIQVTRVSAYSYNSSQKKAVKVLVQTTRVVAPDGKSMVSTTTGTLADGKPYKNVEVFDKVPDKK